MSYNVNSSKFMQIGNSDHKIADFIRFVDSVLRFRNFRIFFVLVLLAHFDKKLKNLILIWALDYKSKAGVSEIFEILI